TGSLSVDPLDEDYTTILPKGGSYSGPSHTWLHIKANGAANTCSMEKHLRIIAFDVEKYVFVEGGSSALLIDGALVCDGEETGYIANEGTINAQETIEMTRNQGHNSNSATDYARAGIGNSGFIISSTGDVLLT